MPDPSICWTTTRILSMTCWCWTVARVVELEAVEELEAMEEGVIGVKLSLPVPKPSAAASLPLPSIVMMSLVFRAVMTSLPLPLSDAVTKAGPELMALIRSPTVSSPVDV